MAQNFWLASFAFGSCFIFTAWISLATARTKSDEELKGLVYSLTPKIKDDETAFPAASGCAGHDFAGLLRHPEHYFLVNRKTQPK